MLSDSVGAAAGPTPLAAGCCCSGAASCFTLGSPAGGGASWLAAGAASAAAAAAAAPRAGLEAVAGEVASSASCRPAAACCAAPAGWWTPPAGAAGRPLDIGDMGGDRDASWVAAGSASAGAAGTAAEEGPAGAPAAGTPAGSVASRRASHRAPAVAAPSAAAAVVASVDCGLRRRSRCGLALRRERRSPSRHCRGSSLMRAAPGLLPPLRGPPPGRAASRGGVLWRLRLPLLPPAYRSRRSRLVLRARRCGLLLRGARWGRSPWSGGPFASRPSKPGGPRNSVGRPGGRSRSFQLPPKPPAVRHKGAREDKARSARKDPRS